MPLPKLPRGAWRSGPRDDDEPAAAVGRHQQIEIVLSAVKDDVKGCLGGMSERRLHRAGRRAWSVSGQHILWLLAAVPAYSGFVDGSANQPTSSAISRR